MHAGTTRTMKRAAASVLLLAAFLAVGDARKLLQTGESGVGFALVQPEQRVLSSRI